MPNSMDSDSRTLVSAQATPGLSAADGPSLLNPLHSSDRRRILEVGKGNAPPKSPPPQGRPRPTASVTTSHHQRRAVTSQTRSVGDTRSSWSNFGRVSLVRNSLSPSACSIGPQALAYVGEFLAAS
jgi:hypothetical protein